MAFAAIAYTMPQYEDFPNYWMKAFAQGTTDPIVMATDSTGVTTAAKFELNSQGFPITAGNALVIPFINDIYDLWLFPTEAEADANDTTNATQLADNINPSPWASTGVGRTTQTATSGQTVFTVPTYVPGSGNLGLYVNGVRQTLSEYTETNATTVTFNADGLDLDDVLEILIQEMSTIQGQIAASSVTYNASTVDVALDALIARTTTVIPQTGGGTLTALRINQLRDASTYTLPLANSILVNQTIIISLPDEFSASEPTVQRGGSDTITDSTGTDTSILFDSGSITITLTSDGVSDWSL